MVKCMGVQVVFVEDIVAVLRTRPSTMMEIADTLGVKPRTARDYVMRLCHEGRVVKNPNWRDLRSVIFSLAPRTEQKWDVVA